MMVDLRISSRKFMILLIRRILRQRRYGMSIDWYVEKVTFPHQDKQGFMLIIVEQIDDMVAQMIKSSGGYVIAMKNVSIPPSSSS